MSGYFGLIPDGAALLSGSAPMVLGGVVLEGQEVPGRISIGGRQAVVVHRLPGGGKTIDAMGPDDDSIAWRGVFAGPYAAQRARMLDIMRRAGGPQSLSFADYTFTVVIARYEYDYRERGAVIAYSITCEIMSATSPVTAVPGSLNFSLQDDLTVGGMALSTGAAVAASFQSIGGRAQAAGTAASAYAVTSLVATFESAAASVAATGTQTQALSGAVGAILDSAGVTLQSAINSASVGSLSASASGSAFASSPALAKTAAEAATLASLIRASGYLNRTAVNLARANLQKPSHLIHA